MRQTLFALLFVLAAGGCCTKADCVIEYYAPTFTGFRPDEIDKIRIVAEDMEGNYPPDTIFTRAVVYRGNGSEASIEQPLPFFGRNSYTYYLPATQQSFKIDGYEFSYRSCSSCFPKSAESNDHAVLQAYHLNGVRKEGTSFAIVK